MKEAINESKSSGKRTSPMDTLHAKWETGKRRLASFLQVQSERLSPDTKRIVLALFGIVMGGLCLLLILRPISDSPTTGSYTVSIPKVTPAPKMNEQVVTGDEYRMLADFIRAIDSLKQHDIPLFKEIIEGREGLLDTVRFLLQFHK